MIFEILNQDNVEDYIAYLKIAMSEEPNMMTIEKFINKSNIDELLHIESLIKRLDIEERCRSFGGEFSFFLHQGSCDGENEKLYDVRVTPEDLNNIPELLEKYTLVISKRVKLWMYLEEQNSHYMKN